MAKHRTRKQKISAHYHFVFEPNQAHVKGQKNIGYKAKISQNNQVKKAENMAQASSTPAAKRNIIKSLILASFMLSLEVVVYLLRR